jgi:hypothetical protein
LKQKGKREQERHHQASSKPMGSIDYAELESGENMGDLSPMREAVLDKRIGVQGEAEEIKERVTIPLNGML